MQEDHHLNSFKAQTGSDVIDESGLPAKGALFLDRDGVINQRTAGTYVREWKAFRFLEGSLGAIQKLSHLFARIFIVTNQQGIGKGLMTDSMLHIIHQNMLHEINVHGGRIDQIFFCPHLEIAQCNCRKPGIEMAVRATQQFPEIRLDMSVMVGDSQSDILFGKNAGMTTVLIEGCVDEKGNVPESVPDHQYPSLLTFAESFG